MSHHNFEMSPELRKAFGLGATGQYPNGKVSEHDEGEIRFGLAADPTNQRVLIDFGKPVHSLGLTVQQAQGLVDALQKKIWQCRGITPN